MRWEEWVQDFLKQNIHRQSLLSRITIFGFAWSITAIWWLGPCDSNISWALWTWFNNADSKTIFLFPPEPFLWQIWEVGRTQILTSFWGEMQLNFCLYKTFVWIEECLRTGARLQGPQVLVLAPRESAHRSWADLQARAEGLMWEVGATVELRGDLTHLLLQAVRCIWCRNKLIL